MRTTNRNSKTTGFAPVRHKKSKTASYYGLQSILKSNSYLFLCQYIPLLRYAFFSPARPMQYL